MDSALINADTIIAVINLLEQMKSVMMEKMGRIPVHRRVK